MIEKYMKFAIAHMMDWTDVAKSDVYSTAKGYQFLFVVLLLYSSGALGQNRAYFGEGA
jgi:hypothetical protein